jgi:hypothetical protein
MLYCEACGDLYVGGKRGSAAKGGKAKRVTAMRRLVLALRTTRSRVIPWNNGQPGKRQPPSPWV